MTQRQLRIDGPEQALRSVVLAHGAGAGMDVPFLCAVAEGLAQRAWRVVRFEFPYMARMRASRKREPPDAAAVLMETWRAVIREIGAAGLVIGGKSMGGRIASLVADEMGVAGLVCLGYPFHPVGKPAQTRVEHLRDLATPTLVVQGERDPFGNRADVNGYALSSAIRVEWIEDGDHDWKPRKSSGRTQKQNWDAGVSAVANFVASLPG